LDYAHPVPTLGRGRALTTIQTWLEEHRIFSRGRFGSWRYEIGNMDHAVKMGIDIARRLVEQRPEELWTP
jgi:predicted ABC-type sugar transport system permease subunit